MGSTGKTTSSRVRKLVSALDKYDKRFSDDVIRAGDKFHSEFPDFPEITTVNVGALDGVAGMNGLGMLTLNPKYLVAKNGKDSLYDYEDYNLKTQDSFHAGEPNYEQSVVAHELGHNLDLQFRRFVSERTPAVDNSFTITKDDDVQIYSNLLGRPVKIGDTVSFPDNDTKATMFSLDGKNFTYQDLIKVSSFSDVVVPMAIKNIQDNWQSLGFKSKPTETDIVSGLSGYSSWSKSHQPENYYKEVFAESYSSHASYGGNANVLAQEVMRLTKQAYAQVQKNPKNNITDFYKRYSEAYKKVKHGG